MPGAAHDLAAAYVLDALEARELRAYERHVGGCAICRRDVRELGVAAAALGVAVPPVAPPSGLRGRVLADVRRPAPAIALRRSAVVLAAAAALVLVLVHTRGNAPGTRTLTLVGAHGSLVVEGDAARLVVDGLPAAPAGRTYEAWVVRPDGALPAGLFRGGGSPTVAVLFRSVPRGARVAVTLERAGGVVRPHGRALFRTGAAA